MSISTISDYTNTYQNGLTQLQSMKQDFTGLSTSLASNDLAAAQNAFTTLMQDLGNASTLSSQQTAVSSTISADLTAVGNALNANDLTTAQKAFATLTQDLKAGAVQHHHGHRHHHHAGNAQNNANGLTTDLTNLGTALQSGDLSAAQKAFATLMQDIGNNSTQAAAASNGSSAQSASDSSSSTTSSLLDTLQFAAGGLATPAFGLLQALHLYAQGSQLTQSAPTSSLFSATG